MAEPEKHSILIVDDEVEILHSLRGLLRMTFNIHTANSGPEALRILQEHPIQVVLSDQRMPGMEGVQVLEQAHSERPRAVRVLFTGYTDVKAVIEAINKGQVFRYLTKPWEPDQLMATLHEACAEYERLAYQQQLFIDLQNYQMRCIALIEGLQAGQFGTLNDAGDDEVSEVAALGYTLLDRFDRSIGLATEEGGGG